VPVSLLQVGFRLNNGMYILGPMAIFPRTVLSWNVGSVNEVNEDSLSLFCLLEPKIGKNIQCNPDIMRIYKIWKNACSNMYLTEMHKWRQAAAGCSVARRVLAGQSVVTCLLASQWSHACWPVSGHVLAGQSVVTCLLAYRCSSHIGVLRLFLSAVVIWILLFIKINFVAEP
jgi:hypothetical protein